MASNIPAMDKKAEKRLLEALEIISNQPNVSDNPNSAITKAASELKIPAGHIHLLVNAYNTGRAVAQRKLTKNASDVWERSEPFPIADTQVILEKLYPENIKKAELENKPTIVDTSYSQSPFWVNRLKEEKLCKEALSFIPTKLTDKQCIPLPKYTVKDEIRQQSEKRAAEKVIEEAKYKVAYVKELATEEMNELIDYFKVAGSLNYSEVKDNCSTLYGEQAHPLFEYIEAHLPLKVKQAKSLSYQPARGKPYDKVAKCLDLKDAHAIFLKDLHEKQASDSTSEHEHDDFFSHPILGKLSKPQEPSLHKEAGQSKPSFRLPFRFPFITKQASFLGSVGATVAKPLQQGMINAEEAQKVRAKNLAEMTYKKPGPDEKYDTELAAIKRESLLHDLLSDPVISAHDPRDVAEAFSDLKDLAPMSSLQRPIMRDFIRRRLEGGPHSYFDLEALTRIEKNLHGIEDKDEQQKQR